MCRFWIGWARAVGISEQRANRNQYGADRIDGRPIVLDEIHAECAVRVDVRVELQSTRHNTSVRTSAPTSMRRGAALAVRGHVGGRRLQTWVRNEDGSGEGAGERATRVRTPGVAGPGGRACEESSAFSLRLRETRQKRAHANDQGTLSHAKSTGGARGGA